MTNDVRISGYGTIDGGEYNDIIISGAGKVKSDVKCNNFTSSGSVKVLGNINSAGILKLSGGSDFDKTIYCKELIVSGASSFYGKVKCNDISVSGSAKFTQQLDAETATFNGYVEIKDANIDRTEINSRLFKIENLCGDKVVINYKGPKWKFINKIGKPYIKHCECTDFNANIVECDELYVGSATIGPYCHIKYLEYSDEVTIDERAVVENLKKI